MVNGLPGNMATLIAKKILREECLGLYLVPYSFVGPEIPTGGVIVEENGKSKNITFIRPVARDSHAPVMKDRYDEEPRKLISVDFTVPEAVNANADFYCRHGLPFVMGTTGGDRKALEQRVRDSGISAVVAPNMAMPIVAFQRFMDGFSHKYAGLVKGGCELRIVESHQQGKKDTSGTARAMVGYFNKLGIQFTEEQIEKIRNPDEQRRIGVPEEHLNGHGWHSYTLQVRSSDGQAFLRLLRDRTRNSLMNPVFDLYEVRDNTASLEILSPSRDVYFRVDHDNVGKLIIEHNINGREVYVNGAIAAIRFLDERLREGSTGQVYSMIDVLEDLERAA